MSATEAVELVPQNVTFAEGVIKDHPAEPLAPLAGHTVVVFEKIGAGEQIYRKVKDREPRPGPPLPWERWFRTPPQYVAFAVTSELQRATRVLVNVTTHVELYRFQLAMDLVYGV